MARQIAAFNVNFIIRIVGNCSAFNDEMSEGSLDALNSSITPVLVSARILHR